MGALAQRVLLLALTTSVVLLPLLLLAPQIQRRYQAKTCYYLWLLLAVRLLLPVELELPRAPVTIQAPAYALTVPAASPARVHPQGQVPETAQTARPARHVPVGDLLTMVWLAGGAVFLLWNIVWYRLARRRLLNGSARSEADERIADGLRRELGLGRGVPVRRTAVGTPMTLGLLRPQILLPEDLTDEAETMLILRHELCHVRRRDLWYKALFLLVNAVYWFDPLVWLMCREAGRNLEYCCDDAVVEGRDGDFRYRYGRVLLGRAETVRGDPALSTRFGGGAEQTKGRLMNLFKQKKRGCAMVCLVLGAALLAGGLVACKSAEAMDGPAPISTPVLDGEEPAVTPCEAWMGISLAGIPADWAGKYRVEEHNEKEADYLEFYYGADDKMLFVIQAVDEHALEARQITLGRGGAEYGLIELGIKDGRDYLLGYPRAAVGDEQDYADMLAQVPELAEQLRLSEDTAWQWPVSEEYELVSRFGRRVHPLTGKSISHNGTDIAAPTGTGVQAAAAGTVEAAGYDQKDGNYVLLTHDGGAQTYYAALKDLAVGAGDKVAQGQVVGSVGSTGTSTGPHLHFEVRQDGAPVDPAGHYPSLADPAGTQGQ